jgi:hypothetical protein
MRSRGVAIFAAISAGAATMSVATLAAWAQTAAPVSANERQVFLVKQDESDCANTTVPSGKPETVGGELLLTRDADGNTTVKIAMTVSPDTTYHFFLKCVRQLGDIKTGDEGTGFATFTFPTNSVGATYGFDMYPEGAPLGNKFQSATVKF